MAAFQQLKTKQVAITPVFEEDKQGKYHYFKPIILQAMCLNCHGEKLTIYNLMSGKAFSKNTLVTWLMDYKEGDLRGVWHVIFPKKGTE